MGKLQRHHLKFCEMTILPPILKNERAKYYFIKNVRRQSVIF